MHIKPANLYILCEHAGRPEEKVSRYTGRPGTRGLTLTSHKSIDCCIVIQFQHLVGRVQQFDHVTVIARPWSYYSYTLDK